MKESIKNTITKTSKESVNKLKNISQEDLSKLLDACYDKSLSGLPGFKSSQLLADEYSKKYKTTALAADKLINAQVTKCATSGFLTGLGGLIALPIAVPADLTACILVQFRMIAAISILGGYNPTDDEVRTVAYFCLTGQSITEAINKTGVKAAEKVGTKLVDKIPGQTLININKKLGSRVFTKFGKTGLINFCDFVPVLGGIVGGSVNYLSTRKIGKIAVKEFINS